MPKSALWILALTAVIFLSYWKIVFTKQFSILWQWEMVSEYYSWYTFAATWIRKGIIPLWDPFRYGGNSYIGEMQAGLFYPLKLALYLAPLDRYGLLSERAFNLYFVFSHWLAGLWMYLLARYLKLTYFPSLVAASCFALAGIVQWVPWLHILDAMAWLPLVVLFELRAFNSTRLSKFLANAGVAGLALGMTFLAGGLHIAIMDGIVVATLAAYLWLCDRKSTSIVSAASLVTTIGIISFLFGAVQMLPSLEYSPLVYRWVGADSPIQPFQRIPYTVLGATAFGPQSIVALVLGDVRSGKSDMTAYFGVLPLLLVIIGGWKCWRNPLVKYLVGLAVVVWIYSWASSSLLHGILYLVPLLDISREADRFYYLTNFATALLAGFGAQLLFIDRNADELASLSKLLPVLKWAVIAFAGLLVVASLHLTAAVSEKTYLSFFLLAASYALLVFLQKPRETRAAQFIAIFLIAWDLYSFGSMIQDKKERQKINGDALAHLVYHRNLAGYIKSQPGMPRVHFDMEAGPNIGNTYEVPITWAMGATLLKDFSAGYGSQRQFDLLGVRYIVRPRSVASSTAPVYEDDMWKAYENPTALPRAWVVHRVELDESDQLQPKHVLDRNFDLRRVGLIDQPLDATLSESSNDAADTVRWLRYEPNLVEVEVTTETPGLLVLGEVYYPGWNAQVDGTPAKIYRTDGLVRGVSVARGTHRVLMRYQPASVRWGAILTSLTFILVCGGACYTLRPLS